MEITLDYLYFLKLDDRCFSIDIPKRCYYYLEINIIQVETLIDVIKEYLIF